MELKLMTEDQKVAKSKRRLRDRAREWHGRVSISPSIGATTLLLGTAAPTVQYPSAAMPFPSEAKVSRAIYGPQSNAMDSYDLWTVGALYILIFTS
ncbi:hypothetical protein TorRG33x02_199340 [Trema orientale]|uniref:Uncharacterized protein n=1 Tax=Trema orientale TaxID=63057 RepID=A0A2P5EFJ5_TREOI|nr:hypothetical protein TorRG33x02_199340 [Trema orientale]